jgi:hypothetical protein
VTNIDFTDKARRARLFAARELITKGYRILRDDVGADNPADNAFLREAAACATAGLIWVGDRGGTDARSATGEEVEIKSTRLDRRSTIAFPTSRYVSQTVIDRFRAADWWLFAVFDVYEAMVGLYRVERDAMAPLIDVLEQRMQDCVSRGVPLQNNPKFPFSAIRPRASQVIYFDHENYDERNVGAAWMIVRR